MTECLFYFKGVIFDEHAVVIGSGEDLLMLPQPAFTCSKLTIETLEQGV